MASQIPIKVMKDGSDNTCGLAQFTSSDSVAITAGGTGLTTQGICAFAQPGIQAVACKTTYIGICAGKSEAAANENTYVGYGAGQNVTTGCYHTIIGSNAGDAITTCSSSVLIGYNAGTAITFGLGNTAIGTSAGASITTVDNNTLVGYISGCVTTGSNNTGLGACVLALNTVGVDNVVIGSLAGKTQVASGCNNTYIGSQAGEVALCQDNTLVGAYAGTAQTTATCNVMLGGCVGYGVVGGAGNVYLGYKSGLVNTSGNDNVFIGKSSGVGSTASCCLIIGNGTCDIITGSFATGNVGIGTGAPATLLHIQCNTDATMNEMIRLTNDPGASTAVGTGVYISFANYHSAAEVSSIRSYAETTGAKTALQFYTHSGGDYSERMRICGDGDVWMQCELVVLGCVGIGTTAPDGKLHVMGASAGSVTAYAYANVGVFEGDDDVGISILGCDACNQQIAFGSPTDNTGAMIRWVHDNDLFTIGTANPGASMRFMSDDMVEAIRIDSSQNVGIGTTVAAQNLVVSDSNAAGAITIRLKRTNSTAASGVIDWVGSGDAVGYSIGYNQVTGLGFEFNENGDCTRMYIEDGGNVGIGTTDINSSAKLDITGGAQLGLAIGNTDQSVMGTTPHIWLGSISAVGNLAQIAYGYNNGGNYNLCAPAVTGYIATSAAGYTMGDLFFATRSVTTNTAPTERMRITNGGRVGIGTTAPFGPLHTWLASSGATVNYSAYSGVFEADGHAGISILSGTACAGNIYFGDSGNNDIGFISYEHGSDSMSFGVNAEVNVRFTGTKASIGNVPPATPDGTLHVFTATAGTVAAPAHADDLVIENSTHVGITFLSPDNTSGYINFGEPADNDNGKIEYSHYNNSLNFSTNAAERIRIDCDGNVGIGTTTPGALLHLQGADDTQEVLKASGYNATCNCSCFLVELCDVGSLGDPQVQMYDCDGTRTFQLRSRCVGTQMVVGGNVGIGTGSVASIGTGFTAVQVGGNAALMANAAAGASNQFDILQNTIWNGSNWVNISTDESSSIELYAGKTMFFNDASQTAGATTTRTERMTICSNGNVGIGGGPMPGALSVVQTVENNCGGIRVYETNENATCGWGTMYMSGGALHMQNNYGYVQVQSGGGFYVSGALSKASGSFRIKHPLESKKDTHCLIHSFIEGPQADLIYSGTTQLSDGTATINVDTEAGMTDGTFVALNRCIRVFTSNESNWDAVRGSITDNVLTIESNIEASSACISWMVIGERCDDHMMETDWTDDDGKVIVEPLKEIADPEPSA